MLQHFFHVVLLMLKQFFHATIVFPCCKGIAMQQKYGRAAIIWSCFNVFGGATMACPCYNSLAMQHSLAML
jgi:hypothetical protein